MKAQNVEFTVSPKGVILHLNGGYSSLQSTTKICYGLNQWLKESNLVIIPSDDGLCFAKIQSVNMHPKHNQVIQKLRNLFRKTLPQTKRLANCHPSFEDGV